MLEKFVEKLLNLDELLVFLSPGLLLEASFSLWFRPDRLPLAGVGGSEVLAGTLYVVIAVGISLMLLPVPWVHPRHRFGGATTVGELRDRLLEVVTARRPRTEGWLRQVGFEFRRHLGTPAAPRKESEDEPLQIPEARQRELEIRKQWFEYAESAHLRVLLCSGLGSAFALIAVQTIVRLAVALCGKAIPGLKGWFAVLPEISELTLILSTFGVGVAALLLRRRARSELLSELESTVNAYDAVDPNHRLTNDRAGRWA